LLDVTDVSQAARRERTLRKQREALAAKNGELEQFTHFVSHDLQQPLRQMASLCGLLELALPAEAEDARRVLSRISGSASRLRTLVRDLLRFCHAGRDELEFETTELGACMELALDALAVRVAETGAEVQRTELPAVDGDGVLLTQVFQNLLGNAFKFSNTESPIVEVTSKIEDDVVIVGVRDNGIGLEATAAERIFDPFVRVDGNYEGSGIGLAVCRRVIERHGGKIWVESTPGEGAHFRFSLPVKRNAA
jgi:signal transduction histidine kinase